MRNSRDLLITGSSGFLGSALLKKLPQSKLLGRSCPVNFQETVKDQFIKREITANADYFGCFEGVDTVIHCAARVHVMNEKSSDPLQAFREVNVNGTLNLAEQATEAGVQRFIFISSIKVNGESTLHDSTFTSGDQPSPEDPYGVSKYEAEQGLMKLCKYTGMELVIIRPTLVYGVGVKGNLLNLLKLCKSALPLPFGAINNARSMVYLGNLVDLIITCIDHPKAAGKVFLASDGDDFSLTCLLSLIRKSMGKPTRLLPIPSVFFTLLGKVTGKTAVVDRLVGNLQVDSCDAKKLLGWQAPYTVEQGIKITVDGFMKS